MNRRKFLRLSLDGAVKSVCELGIIGTCQISVECGFSKRSYANLWFGSQMLQLCPSGWSCPRTMVFDSMFTSTVERRKITKSNKSVAQCVLNVEVEANCHRRYHVWETPV
eukprot:3039782-Pleurochrysis_carterae.AAC.1